MSSCSLDSYYIGLGWVDVKIILKWKLPRHFCNLLQYKNSLHNNSKRHLVFDSAQVFRAMLFHNFPKCKMLEGQLHIHPSSYCHLEADLPHPMLPTTVGFPWIAKRIPSTNLILPFKPQPQEPWVRILQNSVDLAFKNNPTPSSTRGSHDARGFPQFDRSAGPPVWLC